MKKKYVIAIICAIIGITLVALIVGRKSIKDFGESVGEDSTESLMENIISSFGDEEEAEVENDAQPIYQYSAVSNTVYSEEELPEYMKKLQEEQATETVEQYEDPNFNYSIQDMPEQDYASVSIPDCTWYYIEDGKKITVAGVTADNIPTGMYLCDESITGAVSLEAAPKINLNEPHEGYYIGGVNIAPGYYKVMQGYIGTASSYVGLQAYDGQVTTKYAGASSGSYNIDEDDCIIIADGAYYYLIDCILKKAGD